MTIIPIYCDTIHGGGGGGGGVVKVVSESHTMRILEILYQKYNTVWRNLGDFYHFCGTM